MKDRDIEKVAIHTEYIQLDQLLKFQGMISTGGQIKPLVDNGKIFLNGKSCTEKRKKIYPGDVVDVDGFGSIMVVAEEA